MLGEVLVQLPLWLFASIFWTPVNAVALDTSVLSRHVIPIYTTPDTRDVANSSTLSERAFEANGYSFDCDDVKYGHDLDVDDCMSALSRIINSRASITFADREETIERPDWDPLPWRWMGGRSSCYIEPVLKAGAQTGKTTFYKIREAAYELVTTCALRQGKGGTVSGLGRYSRCIEFHPCLQYHFPLTVTGCRTGGDNNVEITLGRYVQGELAVKCGRRKENLETCRDLLISMPITTQDQRFGPRGDSTAEVILPWGMMSRKLSPDPCLFIFPDVAAIADDDQCVLKILTINRQGESDVTSWYKAWEAVNAVYYGCISKGFRGSFQGLGKL
ncbi:MAG: hypothetical protein LQ352_002369 [Teloschistes flavicans]|nr:MAG: hypothetical protein LQ352_002369 [Teloschistes flavicans]